MYDVFDFGYMITDTVRVNAFQQALKQVIRPDSVVLDIGAGFGIFGLLACQLGARKVYAVDPLDIVSLGRDIAAANGYGDRMEFIQALSTKIDLPEKVDVIVSELHGTLPYAFTNIPDIIDARQRFLKESGVLIPTRDAMHVAPVESTKIHERFILPWDDNPWGLDLRLARQMVLNMTRREKVKPEHFLSPAQEIVTVDYRTVQEPNLDKTIEITIGRDGLLDGLCVWFDGDLVEGVTYSNAPGLPIMVYGSGYFPLLNPVEVVVGDVLTVRLEARLIGEDYTWQWRSRITSKDGGLKANFNQSTLLSFPLSLEQLRKGSPSYEPTLKDDGKVLLAALELMDKHLPLEAIAAELAGRFPLRFPSQQQSLVYIGKLSKEYSD